MWQGGRKQVPRPQWALGQETMCPVFWGTWSKTQRLRIARCWLDTWSSRPALKPCLCALLLKINKQKNSVSFYVDLIFPAAWELVREELEGQVAGSQFSSVQSLSHVWLFATPWIAARQASLSLTNSRSSPKLIMCIESVMPPGHLILCRPLLLLPPVPPSNLGFINNSLSSVSYFSVYTWHLLSHFSLSNSYFWYYRKQYLHTNTTDFCMLILFSVGWLQEALQLLDHCPETTRHENVWTERPLMRMAQMRNNKQLSFKPLSFWMVCYTIYNWHKSL